MKLLINGAEFPASRVTFKESGFGRPFDHPSVQPFECEIPRAEFRRAVEDKFNEFSREMKADVEKYGEHEAIEPLHDIGYPEFDEVIGTAPHRLGATLLEHMPFGLLEALFGDNEISACPHVIYCLTDIVIGPTSVVLSGRVHATMVAG